LKTAAGIEEDNVKIRLIDPADPAKISEQLESFGFDKQLNYIVNVTGGTKIDEPFRDDTFHEGLSLM
jgi:hypothetical protein